jgi:pimeloyl-ACP methyl ester carboxylesterase
LYSALDWEFSPVAFHLTECADNVEPGASESQRMRSAYPEFGAMLIDVPDARGFCQRLGVDAAPLVPQRVEIDALVVSMQLDPVTPWRVAREALPDLPRAHWRLLQGAGHGVANSDVCGARAVGAYLNTGTMAAWDACTLIEATSP